MGFYSTLIENFLRKRQYINLPIEKHRKTIGKNQYFCNNSGRTRPIRPIVELDRDIDETELCRKFYHDLTLFSKVIVYTDGRPDTLTDSRVYSLFEYIKRNIFTNKQQLIC